MAGTVVVPGTQTGFNLQSWKRGAEPATYQKMVAIPIIEDYGQQLYTTGNVRKWARVPALVLGQTADGSGLTYANFIATAITLTAAGNYVALAWSRNEQAQLDFDLNNGGTGEIEQALAEASDQSVLANVQSNTQFITQASIDGPGWRQAVGRLMTNTNGVALPGGKQIYAIFSTTQYPNLMSISEFNNAEIRGDAENPYVKGIWSRGGGVLLNFTTVVAQDGNGWHNTVFIPEAYVIGWNTKTDIEEQKLELQHRLIVYNNFGSNVQHDLRAVAFRTTASAL